MNLFDIKNIAFSIWEYPVSYIELLAVVSGLISVYLAARANILTWPTGIVNEFFLFLLFYQVHLYADMFLQVYFLGVTIYGWYYWKTGTGRKVVSELTDNGRFRIGLIVVAATLLSGWFFSRIHLYIPGYFPEPAAYPFTDSFVMIASIFATVLLAKKKIETWYLWIAVDIVCTGLYLKKEIYFLSLEYFIFLCLASYGYLNWKKVQYG